MSDMLRQKESPAKSPRKVVQRISCDIEGVYTIGFMYLKILIRENQILREQGNLGSKHTVNFSKGT